MNPPRPIGEKLEDVEVVSLLKGSLLNYRSDIAERNTYIDTRDRYLYGDGLWEELNIPDGFDKTFYNYLRRISEIHAEQLMGQPFGIYSHYDTQDLSVYDKSDQQDVQQATLQNKMAEARAAARKSLIEAIIRDNGGQSLFADGAQTGSDYGSTLYQMWWDEDEKRIKIELLESIQNWFPIWSDNNFRDRVGDAYVYQIDATQANLKYAEFIPQDSGWPVSYAGDPLINLQGSSSTLTNQQGETVSSASTRRPMVTVINYTGYMPGIGYDKQGNFMSVKPGKEQKLSFKVVGNTVVARITQENRMPSFYYIPNLRVPRRPYGESNLTQAALDINATIIQLKSDQITLANKELFPMVLAKGYENAAIPKKKQREMTIVPAELEQSLDVVNMPVGALAEYDKLVADRFNDLMMVTATPRTLMLQDQNVPNSAQAMLQSMSPIINVLEKRQKNWSPVLVQMFTDALNLAAEHDSKLKDLLSGDDNWWLYVKWPSVLRKEDPAYQSMLINDVRAGLKSVQSYMEDRGYENPEQEIDRIEQDMQDKTRAAILGGRLAELAQFTIYEALGIPLYGFNQPKITLKGDLTPEQEANIGATQGWNGADQPFGASMGPQGLAGERANENEVNVGMVTGGTYPYAKYGMPNTMDAQGNPLPMTPGPVQGGNPGAQAPAGQGAPVPQGGMAAPVLTPGQNQPGTQPMSMPGSGATTSSVQGEVKHHNQNRGK